MSHTHYQHLYHVVWSTKERKPLMVSPNKGRIFEYLNGSFKKAKCSPLIVGGMEDHVHVLVRIAPHLPVSEVIRDVKICTSKWIKSTLQDYKTFSWQEGYGSFTVSKSQKDAVFQYILNQEKHHKVRSFKEEFVELLNVHEIEYDEKYLWK